MTTDFAVPHHDPDDYYDVACGVALGVAGFVLDDPTDAAAAALKEVGAPVLDPSELSTADAVVVIGAATLAARHYREDQRIVLFAGDADGPVEYNESLDRDAFEFLRPRSYRVPCFAGGAWRNDGRASYVQTMDEELLRDQPVACWFDKYVSDVYGLRNIWAGPLLRFGWTDEWRGHSVADRTFLAGPDLARDVITGTRSLLPHVAVNCSGVAAA